MQPAIQSTVMPTQLNTLIECLKLSVSTLTELCDAFSAPFLKAISSTTAALVVSIQNVKRNQDQCVLLAEQVQVVLSAIARLHMVSERGAGVGTLDLGHIGEFTETLHKIYVFTEAQHDVGIIKRIFRFNENQALLSDCKAGMQKAFVSFKLQSNMLYDIAEMQSNIQKLHEELTEILSGFSDGAPSDYLSINQAHSTEQSSVSFSLLPPEPKIFHGRQSEVQHILALFSQATPRVIILGPGGIGKTSLARAVLHHPTIAGQYTRRVFIPCDSAPSFMELTALFAFNLGLDPAANLARPIVQFFKNSPPTLLVLDNFETSWEPDESREEVEKLLSLLADVPHLGLLVTMRGAEKPNTVQWTRPFIPPLAPLSHEAAFQTFIDIADDVHELGDVQKLLALTDYLPLAVDIMAHLVDYEECSGLLSKWEQQRTSMIALGTDRKSSLDVSIELSLSSPRLAALPDAKNLLSLLSILPDGLSDSELQQSNIPIDDILTCKAVLLRTSLGYMSSDNPPRLKLLAPIREYLALVHPPVQSHIRHLREAFHPLLKLSIQNFGLVSGISTLKGLTSNRGNLRNLIVLGLGPDSPDRKSSIESAIALNSFMRLTGQGCTDVMKKIPTVLPELQDSHLEVQYITQVLNSWLVSPQLSSDPESLIVRGEEIFAGVQDLVLESDFHSAIGEYYCVCRLNDSSLAKEHVVVIIIPRPSTRFYLLSYY
ncbi:P-loop containing nucleoside triphosphate hydrolase protein [Roridomyces roridus]|uniref:P-loop containing nucleoside triphosphate hydrolase protein n=1 Tax=Roridomyces roridus TaxID=1738132 RepID=A0AAD7BP93_9AGAR|nr:P-loop containing nucleoside triphosphate hydrolase protein [Roridomyces roridus]